MQDIDFDELDRAVSSAINPSAPSATPSTPSESVPVRGQFAHVVHGPEPTPGPAAPSLAVRRRSGRFMDVVHPSSDMRSSSNGSSVPARPVVEESRSDVAEVEEPTAEPVPAPSAFQWPDPLDLVESKEETEEVIETPEEEASVEDTTDDASQPLESPFLMGAKVEKRPLGGTPPLDYNGPFGQPVDASVEENSSTELIEDESDDSDIEKLEAELTGEVEEKAEEVETTEPTPVEETTERVEESKTEEVAATPVQQTEGPTSITQQYKEQSSEEAQPSGAIYDTEAYHQPLAHPVKKKSGILVVVWILALILVGGGIGAAVYFYVLPML